MKKTETKIETAFTYDPAHKFAHYTFDGGKTWKNAGDACEILDKASKGYKAEKDGCTAYDVASDIEETKTSVKSSKATLVNRHLGDSYEEVQNRYFETTASTNWDWVVMLEETLVVYNMNAIEFREFMDTWANWDSHRKVIRFKSTSAKMMAWLEARV